MSESDPLPAKLQPPPTLAAKNMGPVNTMASIQGNGDSHRVGGGKEMNSIIQEKAQENGGSSAGDSGDVSVQSSHAAETPESTQKNGATVIGVVEKESAKIELVIEDSQAGVRKTQENSPQETGATEAKDKEQHGRDGSESVAATAAAAAAAEDDLSDNLVIDTSASQEDGNEKAVSITVTAPVAERDHADDPQVRSDDFDDLSDREEEEDTSTSCDTFAPKILDDSVISLSNDSMELSVRPYEQRLDGKRREHHSTTSLNGILADGDGDGDVELDDVWDDTATEKSELNLKITNVNGAVSSATASPTGTSSSRKTFASPTSAAKSIITAAHKGKRKAAKISLMPEVDIKKEPVNDVINAATSAGLSPVVVSPIQVIPSSVAAANNKSPRTFTNMRVFPPPSGQGSGQFMMAGPVVQRAGGARPHGGSPNSVLMPIARPTLFQGAVPSYSAAATAHYGRPPMLLSNNSAAAVRMSRGVTQQQLQQQHPPPPQPQQPNINIIAPPPEASAASSSSSSSGSAAPFTVVRNSAAAAIPLTGLASCPSSLLRGAVPGARGAGAVRNNSTGGGGSILEQPQLVYQFHNNAAAAAAGARPVGAQLAGAQLGPPFTVFPTASLRPRMSAAAIRIIEPGGLQDHIPPRASSQQQQQQQQKSLFNSSHIIVSSPQVAAAAAVAVRGAGNKKSAAAYTSISSAGSAHRVSGRSGVPTVKQVQQVQQQQNTRGGIKKYLCSGPPPHLKFSNKWRSSHTFICRECGDVFLFRSSLRQHLERRSMLVNYFCSPCNRKLAFVNKCACMNHRLLHKGESSVSGPESAIVTVLPPHMMPPLPEDKRKLLQEKVAQTVKRLESSSSSQSQAATEDKASKAATEKESIKGASTDTKRKEEEEKKDTDKEKSLTETAAAAKSQEKGDTTGVSDNPAAAPDTAAAPASDAPDAVPPAPLSPAPGSVDSREDLRRLLESRPDIVKRELQLDKPISCTECHRTLGSSQHHRLRHFKRRQKNWQRDFRCERCMMLLPNPCAFKAHKRIHDIAAPYVCPVCGEAMGGERAHFLTHVKLRCMHFYQRLVTPCPYCPPPPKDSALHRLGAELEQHVLAAHVDTYYKCVLCPLAYRSMQGLDDHCADMHPGQPAVSKPIYRCPCCSQIIHSRAAVDEHVVKRLPAKLDECSIGTTLQCPVCDVYMSIGVLRKHLATRHDIHAVNEICTECGETSRLLRDHWIHRVMAHTDLPQRAINPNPKPKPKLEPVTPPADTAHAEKLKKMKQLSSSPAESSAESVRHNKRRISETSEASSHTSLSAEKPAKRMRFPVVGQDKSVESFSGQVPTAPPPKARYPCSECGDKFVEKSAAQLHMQEAHGIAPTFACHLCPNTYTSKPQLDAHVKCVHEGRVQSLPFMCFICEEKRITQGYKKRALLEKHLLTVHKIHKNQIDYSRLLPSAADSVAAASVIAPPDSPVKKLRAGLEGGSFSCAKCDFTTAARATFQEHIARHRSADSTSPQCQECGLSFTVMPALQRHVFIVHKIRHFSKYLENAGVKLEPALPGSSPVKTSDLDTGGGGSSGGGLVPTNPTSARVYRKWTKEEKEERKRERVNSQRMEVGSSLDTLTCNVCYRDFANDALLKKHLRVHGMAFIKSKRSRLAQYYDD